MRVETEQELEGFRYRIVDPADIEAYVVETCEAEWDPEDFELFGCDLYDQRWELRQVQVLDIRPLESQLASDAFVADVAPRIETQRGLFRDNVPIPPLILRGKDYLIFDGYARWHFLKERNVTTCLAYVSR